MANSISICILAIIPLLSACTRNEPRAKALDEGTKSRGTENPLERTPLGGFRLHLNGFHVQSGNPSVQVEEQHFCAKLSDEITQCILFDGTGDSAHLTGVEYIVSRRMVESFQPEERRLWHSHAYEVRSGLTVAPALSEPAEREFMKQFSGTYGKVWHTWHSQKGEQLPTGIPQLMMSFTTDGQVKPELVQFRDERLQVSTADKQKARAGIPDPGTATGVGALRNGEAPQPVIGSAAPSKSTRP